MKTALNNVLLPTLFKVVNNTEQVDEPESLNCNRSGTISQGGEIEADFVFTLQVDPVLFKNFVKNIPFLYP